jgi:exonuclease III
MRIVFTILLLFLLSVKSENYQCDIVTNEDRRINKNKLRLMQYNVEWLFIDYYAGADCPGEGCTWKNISHAEKHMNKVGELIKKTQPDIINICEIEGCDELNILKNITSMDYKGYLIKGSDTSTGQNVGMMTKIDPIYNLNRTDNTFTYPIEDSNCGYNGSGSTSVSKNYISYFNWNNVKVALIGFHLIAYPTQEDRCSKREAQAKIIEEEIIENIKKGYEIIAMGDFNDYDEEVLDINNSEPISKVLDIIKGYENDVYELSNLNKLVNKNDRFTNWWDKNEDCESTMDEFVLLDHILVTEKLLKMVKNVGIYHEYDENCEKLDSDHYPVIVDFEL